MKSSHSNLRAHRVFAAIAAIFTTCAHAILDTNNNGLSDLWEKQHNTGQLFSPTNPGHQPNADPDQDGWNNLTEAITGTNPLDANLPSGILQPNIHATSTIGFFQIDHPTVLGKNYQLQGSADLISWLNINDTVLAREEQLSSVSAVSTTTGAPPSKFFWRVIIGDFDSDGDDLTDAEEIILETNPYFNDTDNDGIHDKAEILRTLDPLNPDTDGDGLFDGYEDSLLSNPLNAHSDSDGINDGQEIYDGTNPLLADTDGDGLNDLIEKNLGTNPLLPDTDSDGINDGAELADGTSPLTSDTDLDGIPDNLDATPLANNIIANPDLAGLSPSLLNGLTSLWDFETLQTVTINNIPTPAYANLIAPTQPAIYYGPLVSDDGLISRSALYQAATHSLIAPPQVFSGKTNWSIAFWYKISQGSIQNKAGTINTVLWAYNNGNGTNNNDTTPEFQVHAYKALTTTANQKLTISHYHNGTLQPDLVTEIPQSNPLDNDTWQHLTITKENGTIKLYRNAIFLNQFSTSAAAYTATTTGYFALGRLHQTTVADTALRGKLDRFTIHNRALSATEVTDLVDLDSDKDGLYDRVETATKLWRDANSNGIADPGETTYQNDPFKAQPNNRDTDGDGLTDILEQTLGTGISKPDSDSDLIPDGYENTHGLNPNNSADAALDNDTGGTDGLTNLDEYRHNTDPKKRDTDGDGILDGAEAKGPDGNLATDDGSNPNDASDNGTRPSPSELLTLKLGVGDRSGSHSEDYVLNVFQLQPDGSEKRIYTLRSGGFGQYTEQTRAFPKNHSYTIQIDWQGTNNNAQSPGTANAEGADFDYHLVVEPLSGNQGHILIDSYDPRTKTADPTSPLRDPQDINPADDDNDDVTTFPSTHEPKRVVLLRASILVDANRDGQFSAEDEGQITEQKPWRIWINDDNDWYETGGTDISNGDFWNKDSANHYVDQVRDLLDFFPLTLKIQDAIKLFSHQTYRYSIEQEGHFPTYGFRVVWYPELQLSNSYGECGMHHKDIEYAKKISILASSGVATITNGLAIPNDMIQSLANGKGIVFIEGQTASAAPLQLIIRDKTNLLKIATIELPMRISNVEDMYRTVNLMYATTEYDGTPRNRDSQGTFTRITEPPAYPDSETNGKYFVFVHGFNVSPKKSRGWNAEVFKRMHQLGSNAKFVGVTWDSDELLPNYHRAVFQAFQTGDVLEGALSFTNNTDVTVAAHSLGNMVVSHAIQRGGFLPTRYYSVNAAVPREAYSLAGIDNVEKRRMVESGWKNYWDYNNTVNTVPPPLKHLFAANWHELFLIDDNRSKLAWKNRFVNVKDRTEHYNFYSPGDDVVRDADPNRDTAGVVTTAFSGNGFSAYSWAAQEYVKGGTSLAGLTMLPLNRIQSGWGFSSNWMETEFYFGGESHTRLKNNEEASSIDSVNFKTNPFFLKWAESELLSSTSGSNKAAEMKVQYDVLARGVPAMSFAAATHSIPDVQGNFDMQATMRTDATRWPSEGRDNDIKRGNWLHSDMREVALLHVYKLYQQFINTGNLNQ